MAWNTDSSFSTSQGNRRSAQAKLDDGLMTRFPKPDVVLGQHVMVGSAGTIGGRTGVTTSAADSLQIRNKPLSSNRAST